ncbi:MAG: hypothetical protein WC749_02225 [Dehalococcoidia bacterium]
MTKVHYIYRDDPPITSVGLPMHRKKYRWNHRRTGQVAFTAAIFGFWLVALWYGTW